MMDMNRTRRNLKINNVVFAGFLVRLIIVTFILTIGLSISEPYFISDDMKYENSAQLYLENADSLIDVPLLNSIAKSYISPFWPILISIFAYIFHTIYVGRFLNVIFSTLCILIIYKLTKQIANDEKTAMNAAKLSAYLPVMVLTCCFPIKDIYIMLSVLYAFYLFVLLQNKSGINLYQLILGIALMTGTYFARGAIAEIMLLLFAVFLIIHLKMQKRYVLMAIASLVILIVLCYLKGWIIESFETKIIDYSGDTGLGNGIRLVQINSLSDIYKLPLTYLFATLQPMILNFGSIGNKSVWLSIIAYLNISMYPIAIGNFAYIFVKKQDFLFWISSFVTYSAVIILSLGVFRHYMFLLPIQIINYALCIQKAPNLRTYIYFGSIGLFLIVLLNSII